jgi:MHS family proline/betaine transporter-like MFS transporter
MQPAIDAPASLHPTAVSPLVGSLKMQKPKRSLAAGSIGNLCEIYDFAIFGFSIPILSQYFFPNSNPTTALLSTFAAYGAAFIARPFGGILFGMMADKVGRIAVLTISIWMMALGTMVIGLLPTYQSIGIAAPILLLVCRAAQGLAMGGETTGNAAFILESAPASGRGRWIGWTWFFGYTANAAAALLITILQYTGGAEAYASWIWRVPFLMGGLVGLVGFWLRRSLDDPKEYKEAARSEDETNPLRSVGRTGKMSILHVIMLQAPLAVGANMMTTFLYPFLIREGGLAAPVALFCNAAAIMVLAVMMPISGALSDRFGRKPILFLGGLLMAIVAYPALTLAAAGSVQAAFAGQFLLALGVGLYGGTAFTTMPELFPTSFRATGHAIAYQLGTVIFGGTAPLMAAWLVSIYGPLAPAGYIIVIGIFGAIVARIIPESSQSDLRTSVTEE